MVELPEFWISKTPITNATYALFVASAGQEPPKHWGDTTPPEEIIDHPVAHVSWQDDVAFAEWAGKRLPTQEEWEKAARGIDGRSYPWGDWKEGLCNTEEAGIGTTSPAGQFSPAGDSPFGCVDMAGGEAYYDYQLAAMTGTDLTADEIHALGLAEVARIQGEIREAATALGLPADISMAEINQRISQESPMLTGEALLQKYEQILAAADEASQAYFDLRPSVGVTIKREPDSPMAYYRAPKPGSDEPGVMPVNLDVSPQLVNYNEYVLVHHETIPGHYIQVTLAQELDVPYIQRYIAVNPYRQNYLLQAYVEGWALYAEGLAWEMGLYEGEAWANLGRLQLLLLRAVRTVVDTGIHAKGWTLDEAADYLEEVTGMPQTNAMLTRYLVNPGYPTGYFMGWVKIREMRQQAGEQLGEAFDIQAFHDAILGHGILPIQVMEDVVTEWLTAQQAP